MIALSALTLAGLILSVSAIDVPVSTRYLTTKVTALSQNETVQLVGYMCSQAKGDNISVTMMLNRNPQWNPNEGIIYYYVVDSENKTEKDALCTNMNQGKPGPYCTVNSWPSEGYLYINCRANFVETISFTVDAERTNKVGRRHPVVKQSAVEPLPHRFPGQKPLHVSDKIYLTEFFTLTAVHTLPRLQEAHLSFNFCPTPATVSPYTITSTVFGLDRESAWTMYLCEKLPCDLSHPDNIIANNGMQLPSNTVTTAVGLWKQMYALIVSWGGQYESKTGMYIGHFQFSAYADGVKPRKPH